MNRDRTPDWALGEASRLAPLIADQYAVVVSGPNPVAAAQVALELARIAGATRRVAIADLVGDAAPLLAAVADNDDDAHGISDSFLYGVSLNRIARPIDPAGNVFLMPSGSEPVALPEVYRNDRWRRLAAGFEQVGALLLVVANREVEGFDALCQYVGALLPLDAQRPAPIADVRLLWQETERTRAALAAMARGPRTAGAGAPEPQPVAPQSVAPPSVSPMDERGRTQPGRDPQARDMEPDAVRHAEREMERQVERKMERAKEVATEDRAQRQSRLLATLAAAAAVVLLGLAAWPMVQERVFPNAFDTVAEADPLEAAAGDPTAVETSVVAAVEDGATGDGQAAGILAPDGSSPPRPSAGPLVIANPADSAQAAAYAVYFVAANTVEEARPPAGLATMSGVAVSPVLLGSEAAQWFRVTVGAGSDSAEANALLVRLRNADQIGSANGSIIRVPFAFRLQQDVEAGAANDALAQWAARGIRAYGLRQPDGTVTIYTGAFQNVGQARVLADSLYGAGVPPTLVYRTGRTF